MRLVLDINVVLSALLWGGIPYRLLEFASEGEIELFTSPELAVELKEVLSRPYLAPKIIERGTNIDAILALYLEFAHVVSPLYVPRVVPDDPDDDHVIACALSAQADFIVSGDKDLLRLQEYYNVFIVTAVRAVQIITG